MNKSLLYYAVSVFIFGTQPIVAAAPDVSNVRAAQQPGTKLVHIDYDLSGASTPVWVSVVGSSDGGTTWTLPVTSVSGKVGAGITSGLNRRITWNAGLNWNGQMSDQVKFRVTAADTPPAPAGFATIPAGTFTMGSPTGELGRYSNETQHTVTLTRAFFLQRTEATWSQWNTVRDWALTHGYTDLPTGRNGYTGDASGTHPVTEVSWWDAVKWLNAWSEKEGLTPCYTVSGAVMKTGTSTPVCNFNANGYRLPTESEWEYACRAGTTTAFYNGGITYTGGSPVDPVLDASGWYYGNSGSNTHPVGQKVANAFGLFDMHGNVWEWCWDWYGTYPPGSVNDPKGPASGSYRVIRVGGWDSGARFCRSALRSNGTPGNRYSNRGFRPARSSVP